MKTSYRILGAALATLGAATASAAPIPEKAQPPTMSSITVKMGGVTEFLAKTVTGEPTQKGQKVVLRNLDALIADLEKQCQGCRNGIAKNRPSRPAPDSNIHGGTGGVGDLVDAGPGGKEWAKLTPRERDRILQSMSEGFPPEYRTVLERYYRRLAEEKSATTGAAKPEAETPAAAPETP
ncbi:hypothetical protein [Paludisphaera mucosa]|uniref:Cytochrome c domain-containing protein n=1 Tax=Paludisphaera mucosa TaxID=3030827 RepID=A0ABT6FL21_9BACT|nr:hypothetical protein [Paludisphaera mucosa]MDG3008266.1 hypothetical protein [Paludisphaera mucosa]